MPRTNSRKKMLAAAARRGARRRITPWHKIAPALFRRPQSVPECLS